MKEKKFLKKIARKVVKSLLIGKKENPYLQFAIKKYPIIKKYIGKFIPKKILEKEGLVKFTHPKYGPLIVKRGKKYIVKDKIGESVRIFYHPENWPLAKEIIIEVIKVGAHPTWTSTSNEFEKEIMKVSKIDNLEELPSLVKISAENTDVRIYIESNEDPEWKKDIPDWKFKIGMDIRQYLHEILDKKKTKWLYLGWPFDSVAKFYNIPYKWYKKMIFDSIIESFSKRTVETANFYERKLLNKDKIKIVSLVKKDPTNLELSIKGRKILKDIGCLTEEGLKKGDTGLNIPSGEVFCAPIENSANGKILFEKVFIPGRGFVKNLLIEFKDGKIINFSGEGDEIFKKLLDENTESSKVIAELGIGCNRKAKYSGYILTDEKIFGTIHIAIGNNTGAYGGKNKASLHLDMIKDMKNCQLYVDGELIMHKGHPVIK